MDNTSKVKILLFHPTGNANVRALAEGLVKNNILNAFYTCLATFKNSWVYKFFEFGILRELNRRSFAPVLKSYTYTRPYRELGRLASQKLGLQKYLKHEIGIFSVDRVYHDLDNYVSGKLDSVSAVYAYEDGALRTFKTAKSKGIKCFYDLPTGYWRAHKELLTSEISNRPDWAMTFKCFQDSKTKLERKDQELILADFIFVASNFTKKTLELCPFPLAPIHLMPYGFPKVYKERKYSSIRNRKLKLLFVGGLSQLKGIANLFEAVDFLNEFVELTIVGRRVVDGCLPLEKALAKHNWIPSLPHNKVLELMRTQDIFVFPSLFEGYGLVITEAMAQGTPVITTGRTCGADFIIEGVNGWLVNPGDTDAIVQKIRMILSAPDSIPEIGKAAMDTAERLPIDLYGERIAVAVNSLLK